MELAALPVVRIYERRVAHHLPDAAAEGGARHFQSLGRGSPSGTARRGRLSLSSIHPGGRLAETRSKEGS
jgi:hypothetical protein